TALVRLIDRDDDSTVALLRVEELGDLQNRYGDAGGNLMLQRDDSRSPFPWEARRLLSGVLRDDRELSVRVEALSASQA
ncbi:MAG TPA: polysaccharide biosynthesis protein, partial [Pseudolysinimonas sp.]|nr:polysaccharide biosynthesis protein [Pseudolysinimonas sp.]